MHLFPSKQGASLSVMKQAASNYILSCIETGSRLGIVQFSTNATALSPLTEVKSERDRFSLIDSLPTNADGKTSIGSGLKKGVEVSISLFSISFYSYQEESGSKNSSILYFMLCLRGKEWE